MFVIVWKFIRTKKTLTNNFLILHFSSCPSNAKAAKPQNAYPPWASSSRKRKRSLFPCLNYQVLQGVSKRSYRPKNLNFSTTRDSK